MFKGVLLDFYGTLVHEDDINIDTITRTLQEHSRPGSPYEAIGRFWYQRFFHWCAISNDDAYITQRALAVVALKETMDEFGVDLDAEEVIAPQLRHWGEPPLFDDTMPFLDSLAAAGIKSIVVSNVDRADILSAIAHHQLPLDSVLTSEDARSYKPHPGIFGQALSKIGLGPGEVLHIGDSRTSDVVGATRAGIPVAWLNRVGKEVDGDVLPNFEITSLADLHPVLFG